MGLESFSSSCLTNCSEHSNNRQPSPHHDPHHPSATFRRSHTPVPASPKSVSCADEIDAFRWPNLPKMKIVPPHDIKEKNNTIPLAKWHPPATSNHCRPPNSSSSSDVRNHQGRTPKPGNLRFQDADHRHPKQDHKSPATETSINSKNCGTGIIFVSNCSEGSSGRQPIPHLNLCHPSAVPHSRASIAEIGVLRWPKLPKMIVSPHDREQKKNAITIGGNVPPWPTSPTFTSRLTVPRRRFSSTRSRAGMGEKWISSIQKARANTYTRQPTIPRRRSPTPQTEPKTPSD